MERRLYNWYPGEPFYFRTRKRNEMLVHNPLLASDSRRKQGVKSRDCHLCPLKANHKTPHAEIIINTINVCSVVLSLVRCNMLVKMKLER